ncbi:MAG TPA: glycosyltransferase family 39 protein [Verrucomicrobiae bacterium]|nr:glycosyltransferase family 39 protein [Verrucomicrobiae bacterium]
MALRTTTRTVAVLAGLLVILVVSALIGTRSFFVAHARGDQASYVALAMKLDERGFDEYNLRRVDIHLINGFAQYVYSEDEFGELLRLRRQRGVAFYDEPLFHTPPLFPYLLLSAHRALARESPHQLLADERTAAMRLGKGGTAQAQLTACLMPLVAGLALIVLTFALGSVMSGDVVGLLAAAVVAFSPAVLLAEQRVWADTTLAALVALAVLLAWQYRRSRQVHWLLLAAIVLGLATLTKITGAIAALPLLWCIYASGSRGPTWRRSLGLSALFGIAFLLVTGPWYEAVRRVYGSAFYNPQQEAIGVTHAYFAHLKTKASYTYLLGLPYQMPLFLAGYVGAMLGLRKSEWGGARSGLALWFVSFFAAMTGVTSTNPMLGPEQRYMLPAYAALALLSADMLRQMHQWGLRRYSAAAANIMAVVTIAVELAWAGWVAHQALLIDDVPTPF